MTLLNKDRLVIKPVERIATVIPKDRVTLVLGLPGTGKSTTILKALIEDGIKPIWFNMDESDTPLDTVNDIDMFDGEYVLDFINGKFTDLAGSVVVLDTYERIYEMIEYNNSLKEPGDKLSKEKLQASLVHALEDRAKEGITVIVIAHPEEYVGRDGIFKDNPSLARRAYEIVSFETRLSTSMKEMANGKGVTNLMYLKKARNYNGKTILINWMRD
jgi:KaiC/GvpD/RAD55 family RecA-like ATPase